MTRARYARLLLVGGLAVGPPLSSCSLAGRSGDLATRIAAARTPRDHATIARAFLKKANDNEAAALYHRRVAALYQHYVVSPPDYQVYQGRRRYDASYLEMAKHCEALADDLQRAAGEFRELARMHEQLAQLPPADTQGSAP
jgi:hypothetical protein